MARKGSRARSAGVRSLERGLALLVAMNRRKLPSVVELARETRLPRPTVYRLLETLHRAGFVMRSRPVDRFCLTPKVRSLSDGFLEDDWIAEIAAPLMTQFTRDLVWPAALMTFEQGSMLVRETTHEASVLSIDHGMVGRSLPMLRTAAGRCYLACCSANERRAILEMLAHSTDAGRSGRARGVPHRCASRYRPRQRLCDSGSRDQSQNRRHGGPDPGRLPNIRLPVIDLDFVSADHCRSRKKVAPAAAVACATH